MSTCLCSIVVDCDPLLCRQKRASGEPEAQEGRAEEQLQGQVRAPHRRRRRRRPRRVHGGL